MNTNPGRWWRSPIGAMTLAFAGYVLGSYVGMALRFPPATTSVLWPANAILAAALLLTPPTRWWACLAGTAVAHVLVQASFGWPPSLIAALFATNCSEALITAVGIRIFVRGPLRLDSLREIGVFIAFAAILSPAISSFNDAAVVSLIRGEPFWTVWRTRVFANSLAELSFIPIILCTAHFIAGGRRRYPTSQVIEAIALGSALLVVGTIVLGPSVVEVNIPGIPKTPTVFLLPMFLWSAVRFGAAGIGTSLLAAALIGSFSAINGSRPFPVLEPTESLLALQVYLILMAIPLFAISALFDERRRVAAELARRLSFEQELGRLAVAFVGVRGDQFASKVDDCIKQIGTFFSVDRLVLLQPVAPSNELDSTHRWLRPGTSLPNVACSKADFPWALGLVSQGQTLICRRADDLPPEAVRDRESFTRLGLRSALVAPFVLDGSLHGALSLSTATPRDWLEDEAAQARLFGEVLGNAIARNRSEDALRLSETMKGAILSSLSSMVAVLDRDGTIIAVNNQWLSFAAQQGGRQAGVGIGVNYLEVCREAAHRGAADAQVTLRGLDDVLSGRRPTFGLEYAFSRGDAAYWYVMSVVPLIRPEGGAVISHTDVTERKVAEFDAQRARQELGHFARVATVGELTASLAHQLNQPLTGILSNAQAARRYLEADSPDMTAVRAIVTDIIDDNRRASGVIRRMRELMTKNGAPSVAIDINRLIRDVTMLLKSDTIIRNVNVSFELEPSAPTVRAERVDLEQVVLNLLVNALEAVAHLPVEERAAVVKTKVIDHQFVVVTVQDSGPGLPEGCEKRVFEPFYTTKAAGMGMGLAIARTIVESHGGRIWAEPGGTPGATFHLQLPVAEERLNGPQP